MLIAALRDTTSPGSVIEASLGSVEAIGSDEALKALLDLLATESLGEDRTPRVVSRCSAGSRRRARRCPGGVAQDTRPPPSAAAAAEALGKPRQERPLEPGPPGAPEGPVPRRPQGGHRRSFGRLKDTEAIPALDRGGRRRARRGSRPRIALGRDARHPGRLDLPPRPDRQEPGPPQGRVIGPDGDPRRGRAVLEKLAERKELPRPPCPS